MHNQIMEKKNTRFQPILSLFLCRDLIHIWKTLAQEMFPFEYFHLIINNVNEHSYLNHQQPVFHLYRNQLIELLYRSNGWFLYEGNINR